MAEMSSDSIPVKCPKLLFLMLHFRNPLAESTVDETMARQNSTLKDM